ncbi:uncharacterized protein BDCG_04500 [Blastomyces dermatitidis ER-3]|uniref:Secreted protein n=1 Tax=Ajellomyces dermatitidis (strain ER-3 / ATCC MYA-2586) TaxID=559297 RepID=A0ABP2F313_AJEDR|nr:uncharacterized protein BDCG_04500 [Blastomyces dermatitidis ER-3]EEQ89380.2 hypothetical protein BDCG_04500 [Blastomyces dermatitidis ER-3]
MGLAILQSFVVVLIITDVRSTAYCERHTPVSYMRGPRKNVVRQTHCNRPKPKAAAATEGGVDGVQERGAHLAAALPSDSAKTGKATGFISPGTNQGTSHARAAILFVQGTSNGGWLVPEQKARKCTKRGAS